MLLMVGYDTLLPRWLAVDVYDPVVEDKVAEVGGYACLMEIIPLNNVFRHYLPIISFQRLAHTRIVSCRHNDGVGNGDIVRTLLLLRISVC